MSDGMDRIVVCKHCNRLEYYGDMRWLSGTSMCRRCYKSRWEQENKDLYVWDDLDGPVPTVSDLQKQLGARVARNIYTGMLYAYVEQVSDDESRYIQISDGYVYTIPNGDMEFVDNIDGSKYDADLAVKQLDAISKADTEIQDQQLLYATMHDPSASSLKDLTSKVVFDPPSSGIAGGK
nr:MAG TPA: hypothetical protein [Caudoviricetes sp.]